MSKHNLMKDPAFAQMLYPVEKRLAELDRDAAAQGIRLTDSNARSIYVRAANIAKGKTPVAKNDAGASTNPKDAFLERAVSELAKVRETIVEEHDLADGGVERRPLRANIWLNVLGCLKESCEIRTGFDPGSRGYLDFLSGFLEGKL
jgi:hypothetical protein